MTPFLSIVVTGRNDNHNGDFDLRAEYAIRHNAALLTEAGIDYEYVWVEWNPLPHRPLFGDTVRCWVKRFRGYVVPPAIHNHWCDNPSIGVMQFLAKNVGIRRAQGTWILATNADTYLTPDLVTSVRSLQARDDVMFLAERIDFDAAACSGHANSTPKPFNICRRNESCRTCPRSATHQFKPATNPDRVWVGRARPYAVALKPVRVPASVMTASLIA